MEKYEISWTSRATKDLRKVYLFYADQLGEEKAFELIQLLLKTVDVLSDGRFVKRGAVDEAFSHLKREYRKLIVNNIKITYRLHPGTNKVYINRVFDTRQNPAKNR